jgi:hypothetical protein
MNYTVVYHGTGIEFRWWLLSAPGIVLALLLLSVILFNFLSARPGL